MTLLIISFIFMFIGILLILFVNDIKILNFIIVKTSKIRFKSKIEYANNFKKRKKNNLKLVAVFIGLPITIIISLIIYYSIKNSNQPLTLWEASFMSLSEISVKVLAITIILSLIGSKLGKSKK